MPQKNYNPLNNSDKELNSLGMFNGLSSFTDSELYRQVRLNNIINNTLGNSDVIDKNIAPNALGQTVNSLNNLSDRLNGKVPKSLNASDRNARATIDEITFSKFKEEVTTRPGAYSNELQTSIAQLAFNNVNRGNPINSIKSLINRFDIGYSGVKAGRDNYNNFVSGTAYRYLFEPELDKQDKAKFFNSWQGLKVSDVNQLSPSEIEGLALRDAWLSGRVLNNSNESVNRVNQVRQDMSALSSSFNPYTDERVPEFETVQQELINLSTNVLNRLDYMSKPGIEPMVNLIYSARNELTIDAFQLQNATVVDILMDKLNMEKDRIASGEFKVNIKLAYPSDESRDLVGLRILGPNLLALERLRLLKEDISKSKGIGLDQIDENFGISYSEQNYHTKLYTSESYAMLGSFNLTSPVGNSIRMAGSNFEEIFIFRNYDNELFEDETIEYSGEYGKLINNIRQQNYKTAQSKLFRQAREYQKDPFKYRSISEGNIGGALHAGEALKRSIDLAKQKNNKLFMNLNQVWLLQYSENLFRGKEHQTGFSEFGKDVNSSTRKENIYRQIQDDLFDLILKGKANITVDTHTYEDKVLKPLMSEIKGLTGNRFNGDLGSLSRSSINLGVSLEDKLRNIRTNLGPDINNMDQIDQNRLVKQIAAITSGNIILTTQTMQHVKNLSVFSFTNQKPELLMMQSGSSNYGMSSLDFEESGASDYTSGEISFTLDKTRSFKSSLDFLNVEEEELMLETNSEHIMRTWNILSGREISQRNNMLFATNSTWESQVKSNKVMEMKERLESINKAMGYAEGEGIQVKEVYTQGYGQVGAIALDIRLNSNKLTQGNILNTQLSFRVTAFEDYVYFINQNKVIGKSIFHNKSKDDIFLPYGNADSNILKAGKGTELSDLDTFTNLITSMAGEITYRSLIGTSQSYIAKIDGAGELKKSTLQMLESMATGSATNNTRNNLKDLNAVELRKLSENFEAIFDLDKKGGEQAIKNIRSLTRSSMSQDTLDLLNSVSSSIKLMSQMSGRDSAQSLQNQSRDQLVNRLKTVGNYSSTLIQRLSDSQIRNKIIDISNERNNVSDNISKDELLDDIANKLTQALFNNNNGQYEEALAYKITETQKDFITKMQAERDIKKMKTSFLEPFIARQQASFYSNSQTYYRRQIYGVKGTNREMLEKMKLVNSNDVNETLANYFLYSRATGLAFSASEDIQGLRAPIRGVAEGGGGRETGFNTGMSMFGQSQVQIADMTAIGLAEEAMVGMYLTSQRYSEYYDEISSLTGGSKLSGKLKERIMQDVFKGEEAIVHFTFNTPKKRSQIPQRLKNVIGSKSMFELDSEFSYLLNKGELSGVNSTTYLDKLVQDNVIELMGYLSNKMGNNVPRDKIEEFVRNPNLILDLDTEEHKILDELNKKALSAFDPYSVMGLYNNNELRDFLTADKIIDVENLMEELSEEFGFTEEEYSNRGIARTLLLNRLKARDSLVVGRKGYTEGSRVDGKKSLLIVQLTGAYTDYFDANPFYNIESDVLFGDNKKPSTLYQNIYNNRSEFFTLSDGRVLDGVSNTELGILKRIRNISETVFDRENKKQIKKEATQKILSILNTQASSYTPEQAQVAVMVDKIISLQYGDIYKEKPGLILKEEVVEAVLRDLSYNPLMGLNSNERAALKPMSAVFERVEKRQKSSMLMKDWVNESGMLLAKKGDIVEFDKFRNKVVVYNQEGEDLGKKREYIVGKDLGLNEMVSVVENVSSIADSRNQIRGFKGFVDNVRGVNDSPVSSIQTLNGWARPAEDSKQINIRAQQVSGYNPDNQLIWDIAFLRAITGSGGRRLESNDGGLFKGVERNTSEAAIYDDNLNYFEYLELQLARQLTGNDNLSIEELHNNREGGQSMFHRNIEEAGVWGQEMFQLNQIKGRISSSNIKGYLYGHGTYILSDQEKRGALLRGGTKSGQDNTKFIAASLLMNMGNMDIEGINKSDLYSVFYKDAVKGEYGDWFKGLALDSTIKGSNLVENSLKQIDNLRKENRSLDSLFKQYGLSSNNSEAELRSKIASTTLGEYLIEQQGKAHFSEVQNLSLVGLQEYIYGAILGDEKGKELKTVLGGFLDGVEKHRKPLGIIEFNKTTSDMATIAAALDIATQLNMYTKPIVIPGDINLADNSTILKLAGVMGANAGELAEALRLKDDNTEENWQIIQGLIAGATHASKSIMIYNSITYSFSKEGIGQKGTGGLEFQHLIDPIYQLQESFEKSGSVKKARKTLAYMFSAMSDIGTVEVAYDMLEDPNKYNFLDFNTPIDKYQMLGAYASYTDIDSKIIDPLKKLLKRYELGEKTKKGEVIRMGERQFLGALATDIKNKGESNNIKETLFNITTLGPQSVSDQDISNLENYLIDKGLLSSYGDILEDIKLIKKDFTLLQATNAFEQVNVDKNFGPEAIQPRLDHYGITGQTVIDAQGREVKSSRGQVIMIPGFSLQTALDGSTKLLIHEEEQRGIYLPSRDELAIAGDQFQSYVGDVVRQALNTSMAFTPGTMMYNLRMKMIATGQGGQMSITEEEAVVLQGWYQDAMSIYGSITEATAAGVTQKAMGPKNRRPGAVTTASGSLMVPQNYVVLAQQAVDSYLENSVMYRQELLGNIMSNLDLLGYNENPTGTLTRTNIEDVPENDFEMGKFKNVLQDVLKSGATPRFNRLMIKLDATSTQELSAIKDTTGSYNKREQQLLQQYVLFRQEMESGDNAEVRQQIRRDFSVLLFEGMEKGSLRSPSTQDLFGSRLVKDVDTLRSNARLFKYGMAIDHLKPVKDKLDGFKDQLDNYVRDYTSDYKRPEYITPEIEKQLADGKSMKKIQALSQLMTELSGTITSAEEKMLEFKKGSNLNERISNLKRELYEVNSYIDKYKDTFIPKEKLDKAREMSSILKESIVELSYRHNPLKAKRKELRALKGKLSGMENLQRKSKEVNLERYESIKVTIEDLEIEIQELKREKDLFVQKTSQEGNYESIQREINQNEKILSDLKGNLSDSANYHSLDSIIELGTKNAKLRETSENVLQDVRNLDRELNTFKDNRYGLYIENTDSIQSLLDDISEDASLRVEDYITTDKEGRNHIDVKSIIALANEAVNIGDTRDFKQVMAFRSSPVGGTEARSQMYQVLEGIKQLNSFTRNIQDKGEYLEFSQERNVALSLFNPLGPVTSNLGDWDGDPYTFIFAQASNLGRDILDTKQSISSLSSRISQLSNRGKDLKGSELKENKKLLTSLYKQRETQKALLQAREMKLELINQNMQNQDKNVRKDIANYLGMNIKYFDSKDEGGWSDFHVETDIMYTYLEQGRGLFGGLEDKIIEARDFTSNLGNVLSKESVRDIFDSLTSLDADKRSNPEAFIQDKLQEQIRGLDRDAATPLEKSLIASQERVNPEDDIAYRGIIERLASTMAGTMQDVNPSRESFGEYYGRLQSRLILDQEALANANKLINQGSGTHMTEDGFVLMERVMGKAGSDILGKTYNTLIGALYSTAPELAIAGIFQSDNFRKELINNRVAGGMAQDAAEKEIDGLVQGLNKSRDKNAEALGFIKDINQLLRDGIKPKTPEGGVDSLQELNKQYQAMKNNPDGVDEIEMIKKINAAADNLGPGDGIGLRSLTQLNNLINSTDSMWTTAERELAKTGEVALSDTERLSTMFNIGIEKGNLERQGFDKVLEELRQSRGTENIRAQEQAAYKTALDLKSLIVQYRYNFSSKEAIHGYGSADTIARKMGLEGQDRLDAVDTKVKEFFDVASNRYTLQQSLSHSEFISLTTKASSPEAEKDRLQKLRSYYSFIDEANSQTSTFLGAEGGALLEYAGAEKMRRDLVTSMNRGTSGYEVTDSERGIQVANILNAAVGGKLGQESINSIIETLAASASIEGVDKISSLDVLVEGFKNGKGFSSLKEEDRASLVSVLEGINGDENLKTIFGELIESSAADMRNKGLAEIVNAYGQGNNFSAEDLPEDLKAMIQGQIQANQRKAKRVTQDQGVIEQVAQQAAQQRAELEAASKGSKMELLLGLGLAVGGALIQEGSLGQDTAKEILGQSLIAYSFMRPTLAMAKANQAGNRSKGRSQLAQSARGMLPTASALAGSMGIAQLSGDEAAGEALVREVTTFGVSLAMNNILDQNWQQQFAGIANEYDARLMQGESLNKIDKGLRKVAQMGESASRIPTRGLQAIGFIPSDSIDYDKIAKIQGTGEIIKGALLSAAVGAITSRVIHGPKVNYRALYNERIDAVLAGAEQGLALNTQSERNRQQDELVSDNTYTDELGNQVQMELTELEEDAIAQNVKAIRYDGWDLDQFLTLV